MQCRYYVYTVGKGRLLMPPISEKSTSQTGQTYELPFYVIKTYREHWRIFNPALNKEYSELLRMQKDNTLREKYPKYERPIAAQFVDRAMIEDSLWAETDHEGVLATDDPKLAAYIVTQAKLKNPKAGFDTYSKKMSESEIEYQLKELEKEMVGTVPSPKPYNIGKLVPKNKLVTR